MRNFAESASFEASQNPSRIVITLDDKKQLLLGIAQHAGGELLAAIFTSQEPMPSAEKCNMAGVNIALTAMEIVNGIFECLEDM